MAGKMVSDCGESRQGTASCGHDRSQETRGRDGQTRASPAGSGAGEAQEGRGDRRTPGSRADPLRRLAAQRKGDRLLVGGKGVPEKILFSRRPPNHPGELMREIIEGQASLSVTDAARRMGISLQALRAVLHVRS